MSKVYCSVQIPLISGAVASADYRPCRFEAVVDGICTFHFIRKVDAMFKPVLSKDLRPRCAALNKSKFILFGTRIQCSNLSTTRSEFCGSHNRRVNNGDFVELYDDQS